MRHPRPSLSKNLKKISTPDRIAEHDHPRRNRVFGSQPVGSLAEGDQVDIRLRGGLVDEVDSTRHY
jgi:hypothetical protein